MTPVVRRLAGPCAIASVVVCVLTCAGTASGAPITVVLTGQVTSIGGPQVALLSGVIAVGSPVTVRATYDTSTPDSSPGYPLRGDFFHTSGQGGIVADVNGQVFATDFAYKPLWVFTGDNLFDQYDVLGWQGWSSPAANPVGNLRNGNAQMEVQLFDATAPFEFLTGDALPVIPELGNVTEARGSIFMGYDSGSWAYYMNFTLTPAPTPPPPPVPEPGTIVLLGLGVAGLGVRCRSRRSGAVSSRN